MIYFASRRVNPRGIQAEIVLALVMVDPIFARYGSDTIIISLTDGLHTRATLHDQGLAVDLRSNHIPSPEKIALLGALHEALPPDYEVFLEEMGGLKEHFHIEYDWKGDS
jgi:hypothetical protein